MLSDEEVQKRTDATVKLAAITGETASNVSSYMTAIWNNFAEGSDNLAYYTDVLTALGAATAASSKEIANGLEKFAAVGDTVGLSYEYATAALTTIIDKTRQSEDVVGTALKTLFARIQGLQQGETAEDGVDFNKYSKALEHVGIQIVDTNGKLKDMDAILDEMGEKWGTLEKTEQVALAQTMGGTRQYVQLISLMDNWESMKKNVSIARESEGIADEQFNIYAESWQAASKRMQAATESVYKAILDDKFFIKLTDFFTGIIQQIGNLIKAMGGMQGVFSAVSLLLTKMFAPNIANGINKTISGMQNLKNVFQEFRKTGQESFKDVEKSGQKAANGIFSRWKQAKETVAKQAPDPVMDMKTQVLQMARVRAGSMTGSDLVEKTQLDNVVSTLEIQQKLIESQDRLSGAKLAQLEAEFNINQILKQQLETNAQISKQATQRANDSRQIASSVQNELGRDPVRMMYDDIRKKSEQETYMTEAIERQRTLNSERRKPKPEGQHQSTRDATLKELEASVNEALIKAGAIPDPNNPDAKVDPKLAEIADSIKKGHTNIATNQLGAFGNERTNRTTQQLNALETEGLITAQEKAVIQARIQDQINAGNATAHFKLKEGDVKKSDESISKQADESAKQEKKKFDRGTQATAAISAIASTSMALSTVKGVLNTLQDANMSWTDKLISSFTSIGFVLPSVISSAEKLGTVLGGIGTGPAALIMAVFAGLILAAGALADAIETPEERSKRLAEELEKAAEAADKAANSYKELQSSINSIKDLQDTIKGLRQGTMEWSEAVVDLNNQVLKLLDKYPQLADYITQTNGVWHIEDEGFEEILRLQQREVTEKQQERFDKDWENKKDKQDRLENEHKIEMTQTITDNSKPTNYSNPLGVTNGGLSSVNDVKKIALDPDEQKQILEDIGDHFYFDKNTGEQKIKWEEMENIKTGPVDYSNKEIQQQIENNTKAMIDNTTKVDANSKALDTSSQQKAENWISTHIPFDEETDEGIKAAMARNFANEDNFEKTANEVRAEMEQNHFSDDDYIEGYANLTGKTEAQIKDEINKEEIKLDSIKDAVFNNFVYKKMYDNAQKGFDELSKSINMDDEVMQNLLLTGGDNSAISSLNKKDRQALLNELNSLANNPYREKDKEVYEKQFGEGFIQEQIGVLSEKGYDQRVEEEQKAKKEAEYQNELKVTATELEMEPEAVEAYTNALIEQNDAYKDNKLAALDAAKAQIKFNKGANEAQKVLEEYAEVFNNQEKYKGGMEWSEAIGKLTKSVSDMLGLDVDAEFISDNLGSIQKSLEGDAEALETLQISAAKNWGHKFAENLKTVKKTYKDLNSMNQEEKTFDGEKWAADWSANIDAAIDHLNEQSSTFTLEADTSPALDSIVALTNEAMMAGEMTKEEMEGLFSSLGYSPEVEMVDGPENTTRTVQTGEVTINGMKQQVSTDFTTTTTTKVPQIRDADGDGKTIFTRTPTKASSLAASRSKNTPSSNSKGSSSAKDKKQASDEIERYHTMEKVLDTLQKQLDKISKAKERAFGTDKIALMDQEIAKTQEVIKAQEDLYKEIEKNYAQDRANAASVGAKFDKETGAITNYEEVMQKAIDTFNNSARGEADEERYNQVKEILELYEETHDKLIEESDELIELQNQLADLRLEKIEYEVELKINADERDLEVLEYLFETLDDETFDAANRIANLSSQVDEYISKNKTLIEGISKILNETNMSKDDIAKFIAGDIGIDELQKLGLTQAQMEALLEKRSQLLENNKALLEMEQKVWEEVTKAIQGGVEEFNKIGEAIDHNNSLLENYKNLIDLIGMDTLGISQELIAELGKATLNTAQKDLENSLNKLETLRQAETDLRQKLLDPSLTEESKKEMQKSLDETIKMVREAEEQALDDLKTSIETAQTLYEDAIESVVKNVEKGLSGVYGSLEQLQEAFSRQKKISEIYVEDYKKVYELSKLTRDLTKSINETDNLNAKSKLRDIQKEINNLQAQGVKLSEYDIENMRRKYELRLAEIALEEAQNAKNQVRMTRDSEGNWNYTYTTDETSIEDAEQTYEDKLFAMQEANQSYIQSLQDSILSTESEMISKISEIMTSDDIDDKDKLPMAKETYNDYIKILNSYAQQLEEVLGNNEELATTKFGTFEDYLNQSNLSITTHFDQTTLSLLTGFDNLWGYMSNFKNKIGDINNKESLLGGMASAWTDWVTNLENNLNIAGTSIDNFSSDVTKAKDSILKDNIELQKNSTDTANKVSTNNQQSAQSAYDYSRKHSDAIQKVINKNEILIIGLDNIAKKESGIEVSTDKANKKLKESPNIFDKVANAADDLVPILDDIADSSGDAASAVGRLVDAVNKMDSSAALSESQKRQQMSSTWAMEKIYEDNRRRLNRALGGVLADTGTLIFNTAQSVIASARAINAMNGGFQVAQSYDTGGYTGEWGASGKLAVLHEKEIILNKQDTSNVLKAVDLVRSISSMIDINTKLSTIGNLMSATIGNTNNSTANQQITINAEFPDVTNSQEIEHAFDNLINKASQYANRKN